MSSQVDYLDLEEICEQNLEKFRNRYRELGLQVPRGKYYLTNQKGFLTKIRNNSC